MDHIYLQFLIVLLAADTTCSNTPIHTVSAWFLACDFEYMTISTIKKLLVRQRSLSDVAECVLLGGISQGGLQQQLRVHVHDVSPLMAELLRLL